MPNLENTSENILELFKSADIHRNGKCNNMYFKSYGRKNSVFSEQLLLYTDFVLSSFPYLQVNATNFALSVTDQMRNWTLTDCLDLFR